MLNKFLSIILVSLILLIKSNFCFAFVTGIYLSQDTAESKAKMDYLIKNAKVTGIDTFVVDYGRGSAQYTAAIKQLKANGLRYVARVVVFPYGAVHEQVVSEQYRNKRWQQIKEAIALGAQEIQLDYIRYKPTQKPSMDNAKNIQGVISYFRNKIHEYPRVKLQIDVFGIATVKPALYIGQDLHLFAENVDTICPMLYPSHFEPYRHYATIPYKTIYDGVRGLQDKIQPHKNVNVYTYIELFNYRYPMSHSARIKYIKEQIRAARESGAQGWYAWSAGNHYDILFDVLGHKKSFTTKLAEGTQLALKLMLKE